MNITISQYKPFDFFQVIRKQISKIGFRCSVCTNLCRIKKNWI